jgi:single-strand DNA-binding protein
MAAFNKAILIGRLTADPELKQTNNGITVTSFTVAVDRKAQKDAEKKTDFINCVAWRTTAEFICRYFTKGMPILVAGSIQTRAWSTQEGEKRIAVEVVADEVSFVESKKVSDSAAPTTDIPQFTQSDNADFEEVSADDVLPF